MTLIEVESGVFARLDPVKPAAPVVFEIPRNGAMHSHDFVSVAHLSSQRFWHRGTLWFQPFADILFRMRGRRANAWKSA